MLLRKILAKSGAMMGTILFSAILVGPHGAAGASTGAQDDRCISRSVLDELDGHDRSKLETILKNAGNAANSQAMLWRIVKPGIEASYIFGTVHIADEGLQELRPAVREALTAARSVTLEAAELSRGAMQYAMAQAGPLMVATDKPLQRLLADDELNLVERVLVKAGFPAEMALGFRPWAVTMFLADSDCQKKKQEAGYKSLDLLVADAARARGLKVEGLETMVEQYQTLAAVPEIAQTAWLKASIEMHDRIDDISHTMAELYRFRRIDAVWDLTRELAPKSGLTDAVMATLRSALVGSRNARMVDRIASKVDQGAAFIAVGAMHLSGKDGLVQRLQDKGYAVTAID